jgi:hypothetical protein
MSRNPTGSPESTAVEQLEHFGLSTYAARTLDALASLGTGTAREVSQVTGATAIWGEGETYRLVVLKTISTWRFDTTEPDQ